MLPFPHYTRSPLFVQAGTALAWPIIANHSVDAQGQCTCKQADCSFPGKHPLYDRHVLRDGIRSATTCLKTIEGWFERWPWANVGVRTGRASGLLVLDIDPRHGGDERLTDLEDQYGPVPETVEALTGGGGRHLLFRFPAHLFIKSRSLLRGLDIKAEGGQIIAEPSLHCSGQRYYWEAAHHPEEHPIADAPAWLLKAVQATEESQTPTHRVAPGSATLSPAAQLLHSQEPIPAGARNNSLTRIAGLLRYRGNSEGEIVHELRKINHRRCRPRLGDREVQTIAASIAQKPVGSGRESAAVLQARSTVQVWQAEVPAHAWRGLAGTTRRAVWWALLELAAAAGTLTLGVSLRSLAERAGVSLPTARKTMGALQVRGWLVWESKGKGRQASMYRVAQPPAPVESTERPQKGMEQEDSSLHVNFAAPTALTPAASVTPASALTSPTPSPGAMALS